MRAKRLLTARVGTLPVELSATDGEPDPDRQPSISAPPDPGVFDASRADVVRGAEAILEKVVESEEAAEVEVAPGASDLRTVPDSSRGRPFEVWSRRYLIRALICDAIFGFLAVGTPTAFSNSVSRSPLIWLLACVTGLVLWPIAVGLSRGYLRAHVGAGGDELRAPVRAATAVVVIGAFLAEFSHHHTWLLVVLTAAPTALVYSLLVRYGLRKHLYFTQRRGRNLRRVIVAGGADSVRELICRLEREAHFGMTVVGACLPHQETAEFGDFGVPVLGDLEYLSSAAREFGCDAVAVTSDDATRHSYLRKIAWSLEGVGIDMLVDPGLVEVAGPRMHIRPILGFPLVHVEQPRFTGWRRIVKRLTDVALTALGLVIISPLLLLIALTIKASDGGPILFRQTRVGRNGRPFTMLKFRSMVVDADSRKGDLIALNEGHGGLFKLVNDPRVTRVGRLLRSYSLDELPQLFNVLSGSMSLVGPRPHLAAEIAQMPQDAIRRSLVTPGLTGLWQVSGRSDLNATESVRMDLRYVENWSFTMDLLILWRTTFAVLSKDGAR